MVSSGLPNGVSGFVERNKIFEYLMDPRHPEGAGKARFFLGLGFRLEEWHVLANALLRVSEEGLVANVVESIHGSKYIIDGPLHAPDGQTVLVRTVWIREARHRRARLVTAYPRTESIHGDQRA